MAEQATAAFFGGLGPASAASRLIAAGTTVPLARRSSIRFPRRSGPPEVLPWVAEGAPIPVKQYSLDAAVLGPAGKFATIVVLSAELARASDAEAVFETILREDAAISLDAAIFSDAAASDDNPAGLLFDVTPITAATGGGLGAMQADLSALGRCGGSGRRLGLHRLRRQPGAGRVDRDLRAGHAAGRLAVQGAGGRAR